jgi:HSP90 family molecular chaperone
MTQQQVIDHIGTIAKSGTKERLTQLQEAQKNADHGLI